MKKEVKTQEEKREEFIYQCMQGAKEVNAQRRKRKLEDKKRRIDYD